MKEKIERISIPDDDMPGWIQTLHEAGFSTNEIDSILVYLNDTYADIKTVENINKELARMEEEVRSRRGSGFTEEERESIRKGIESRLDE